MSGVTIKSIFTDPDDHHKFIQIYSALQELQGETELIPVIHKQIGEYATGSLVPCRSEHCSNDVLLLNAFTDKRITGYNYCPDCVQDIVEKLNEIFNSDTEDLSYPMEIQLNSVYQCIDGLDYDDEISILVPEGVEDPYFEYRVTLYADHTLFDEIKVKEVKRGYMKQDIMITIDEQDFHQYRWYLWSYITST